MLQLEFQLNFPDWAKMLSKIQRRPLKDKDERHWGLCHRARPEAIPNCSGMSSRGAGLCLTTGPACSSVLWGTLSNL